VSAHLTRSEGETAALGRDLGRRLSVGDVVLLTGSLGAGKTAFARGLADGLGCDPDDVSSPTFAIVQEYRGKITLQHVDLYRLTPVEVDDLGLDDLIEHSVMAVEWPDRWRRAPDAAWRVTFELAGDGERRVSIGAPSQALHSTR
jgi:tRNA threonylcarbamoyl adenosine modification protein YjeE